jgi:hypothetical protein
MISRRFSVVLFATVLFAWTTLAAAASHNGLRRRDQEHDIDSEDVPPHFAVYRNTDSPRRRVLVQFVEGKKEHVLAHMAKHSENQHVVHHEFDTVLAVTLPHEAAVTATSEHPHVLLLEDDPVRELVDMSMQEHLEQVGGGVRRQLQGDGELMDYGHVMTQADQVRGASFTGQGRTICIVDSGMEVGHADLPTSASGFDGNSSGDEPWSVDTCGHGTRKYCS